MPKNVIITPASGLVDFYDLNSNLDAKIQIDDPGNLSITNSGGTLTLGNTAANVYIGDGTNSVDVIFEQSGAIRALSGKTLTIGQDDSFITIDAPVNFLSPDGTKTITARMLNTDVLSFQGGAGELFSISDSLTGTIFSVNDVSGIPSIEVIDTGLVKIAQYSGNVLLGTGTDNATDKLQVNGSITSTVLKSSVATGTAPLTVTSTTRVSNLNVATAGTADTFTTARNINGTSFNGSADITVPGNFANRTTNESGHAVFIGTTATGNQAMYTNTSYRFNPSTGEVSATNFNSTSDISLKTNLTKLTNSYELIDELNGYSFDWKDRQGSSYGVVAQEVEKVLPHAVQNVDDKKTVNYSSLIPILIEAIKELKTKVSSLTEELETLKHK